MVGLKTHAAIWIILAAALLVGCAQPATGGDDLATRRIRVVATTGMVGDLVRNVGGERVEVVTLMGPGVDPHLYKASADDVVQLQRSVVSLTAVGAFNAVGSVLVVALMVAPPAAAYLLTDRLPHMLALSALFGALAAILGCWAAFALDASIAGAMAVVTGLIFCLAWMFAPQRGLLAQVLRRVRQRWEFAQAMLAVHLLHHEATAQAVVECQAAHLSEHLNWSPAFTERVVRRAEQRGLLAQQNGVLTLTDQGRRFVATILGGDRL